MPATLLLIDDNAIQAATRQAILKRWGYNVITALGPESALEQIREDTFGGQIDLIITDHLMPGMTGSQFVSNLRGFATEIPVLVISGLAEAEEEYRNLSVEFRLKPCPPENLLGCVERLLHARQPTMIESHTNQLPMGQPVGALLQKS